MTGKLVLIVSYLLSGLAQVFCCRCDCSHLAHYIPHYYNAPTIHSYHQPLTFKPYKYQPANHENLHTSIADVLKGYKIENKPIDVKKDKGEIKYVKEPEKPTYSPEKSIKDSLFEDFDKFKSEIKDTKKEEEPPKIEEKPEKKNYESSQNIYKQEIITDTKKDESDEDYDGDHHHEHNHHHHHDKNAHYKFEYSVNDKKTKDVKYQKEELNGDKVEGEYSLVEDDGNIRTVKYSADWKNGFRAEIHNSKKKRFQ